MKQQVISPRMVSTGMVTTGGLDQRLSLAEARHRELDSRLRELGRHAHLTPEEQIEAVRLKKRKLLAKDEIEALRRLS
jgi:hypothetical protein